MHSVPRLLHWPSISVEFHRAGKIVQVEVSGRLVMNDLATKLTACAAGHGIAQTIEFGLDSLFASGELVQILPDWAEERYPLYAYHPSCHLPPAKVRALLGTDVWLQASALAPAVTRGVPTISPNNQSGGGDGCLGFGPNARPVSRCGRFALDRAS